jgi:hypothetical protein
MWNGGTHFLGRRLRDFCGFKNEKNKLPTIGRNHVARIFNVTANGSTFCPSLIAVERSGFDFFAYLLNWTEMLAIPELNFANEHLQISKITTLCGAGTDFHCDCSCLDRTDSILGSG